jgi:hypothetical protein
MDKDKPLPDLGVGLYLWRIDSLAIVSIGSCVDDAIERIARHLSERPDMTRPKDELIAHLLQDRPMRLDSSSPYGVAVLVPHGPFEPSAPTLQ